MLKRLLAIVFLIAIAQPSLAHSGHDLVWLSAGDTSNHFQDDHGPPFKPHPYFTQWVDPQFAHPGAELLLRPGEKPILFTLTPEDYWHATPPVPEYLSAHIDIRTFADRESLITACSQSVSTRHKAARIAADAGDSIDGNAFPGEPNPPTLLHYMDFHRAIKTEFELQLMRDASRVGVSGHVAARDCFYEGGSEFDIHMAYLAASRQMEWELPYENIIAINENAATLHYRPQQRTRSESSRSFLIDAGGNRSGYASDITRSYAAAGDDHAEFRFLIDAMLEHQNRILAQISPGVSYASLHAAMHNSLAQVLVDAQICRGEADKVFESGLTEAFCPHGLGHLLGIQVHDVGGHIADENGTLAPPPANYPSLRFTRTIETDQVFTIEPGLYFIESLLAPHRNSQKTGGLVDWERAAHLSRYGGIRIEDNVRVLPEGIENLTRDAWRQVEPGGA